MKMGTQGPHFGGSLFSLDTGSTCSDLAPECYIEPSFILNLGILAVATQHVKQSGGSQAAVAYTSVGLAFLPHLCGDHHLPHLHANQIKSAIHTA